MRINVPAWECQRCKHIWLAASEQPPARCAKCKSPYWGREKTRATKTSATKTPGHNEKTRGRISIRSKKIIPPKKNFRGAAKRNENPVRADAPPRKIFSRAGVRRDVNENPAVSSTVTDAVSQSPPVARGDHSRHCGAGAHGGCSEKNCGCACHSG